MRSLPSLLAYALASCVLAACVESAPPAGDPTEDDSSTYVAFGPPRPEMETQGRHLLGDGLDDLGTSPTDQLSFSTAATDASGRAATASLYGGAGLRVIDAAGTAHVGNDPWLVGVTLTGDGANLRIDGVGTTATPLYKISVDSGAGFADVCAGDDAVVYAGTWSRAGLHAATVGRLTFACADGVSFKCAKWGYFAGGDPAQQRWDGNQACTRMARADYCGDGRSHTVEGTYIGIYDVVGVNNPPPPVFPGLSAWPPPAGQYSFEAAWVTGAKPVPCLGKVRWQSMPPGPQCGGALPDPRTDITASFCEDVVGGFESLEQQGALLFNLSHYQQLAMDRWHRGNDQVTTIDGYYEPAVGTLEPFGPGWTYDGPDSLLTRSLPISIDPADVESVRVARNTTTYDYVVALYAAPPNAPNAPKQLGYVDASGAWQTLPATYVDAQGLDEGLVFRTRLSPVLVPLYLYRNNATADYLSSVKPPPAGYTAVGALGWTAPSAP